MASDALTTMGTCMFDDAVMAAKLPAAVVQRFNECLVSGAPTPEDPADINRKHCIAHRHRHTPIHRYTDMMLSQSTWL